MTRRDRDYIGDGVYVAHDRYQIYLSANHHENEVIALEPMVLVALVNYAKRIGILDNDENPS